MSRLSDRQRHALAVVAAGETAGRPARATTRSTTSAAALPGARWLEVNTRTARTLIDRGLVRDEMRPTGDGLYLTPAGHAALDHQPAGERP